MRVQGDLDHEMSNSDIPDAYSDTLEDNDLPSSANQSSQMLFNKVFFEKPSEMVDTLNLARSLFDLKEYRKCAHILTNFQNSHQSALFLKMYATYLVSEQQLEEQNLESGDKIQASTGPSGHNESGSSKELVAIESQLKGLRERGQINAINLYLLGVLLKRKNCKDEAREVLIEALNRMPLLWSAWLELASLVTLKDGRELEFNKLRDHWAKNFYYACFFLDKQ